MLFIYTVIIEFFKLGEIRAVLELPLLIAREPYGFPSSPQDCVELWLDLIGTAVVELTAKGQSITKGNILYELERIAASSRDIQVKAYALDAAKLLRKHNHVNTD
ncbi:hypothetical protein VI01_07400 [Pantoea sp. SM3]|nr:hypothetical protein VI01_07400 [Pantoea sp. SM3]